MLRIRSLLTGVVVSLGIGTALAQYAPPAYAPPADSAGRWSPPEAAVASPAPYYAAPPSLPGMPLSPAGPVAPPAAPTAQPAPPVPEPPPYGMYAAPTPAPPPPPGPAIMPPPSMPLPPSVPAAALPPAPPVAAPAQSEYFTLPELKNEMKKLVWKKGDFTLTPYGALWASMTFESERSNSGDFTLYVFSASDQGESALHVDARSTRLGIDFAGPKIDLFCCAPSGGKVEIDFQGQFVTENKPGVLLRHAYWEVKNEDFRLLGGQTWDVISPLNPNSIMYSVYWGAGNIGYRRAQFRGERYYAMGDMALLTFQGSVNADIISEFPTSSPAGFAGDQAAWPVLEGRTAITLGNRGKGGQPITLGLSGHIGEQVYDFTVAPARDDVYFRTYSMCLDLKAPITDRFGFQGEYFCGENLGGYLGGILQGIDVGLRQSIYSQGGWLEVWYDITERLHTHVGYTLDDPLDRDLSSGSARRYNAALWGNLVYDITKQFTTGIEIGSWRTLYVNKEPGESIRVEFMAKYCF